jgi:hypothetical protein
LLKNNQILLKPRIYEPIVSFKTVAGSSNTHHPHDFHSILQIRKETGWSASGIQSNGTEGNEGAGVPPDGWSGSWDSHR